MNLAYRLIISLLLVLVIFFTAKPELIFTVSHERHDQGWYLTRNWKMFEHRAIQCKGWDWYLDNVILRNTYIGAYMIDGNDSSEIFVFNTPYRSVSLSKEIKSIFDIMAIDNDTVCDFMGSPSIHVTDDRWRRIQTNQTYRDSLFDAQARNRFVTFLNNVTSLPYGIWYRVLSTYSDKTMAYYFHPIRINTVNILSDDSIANKYIEECVSNGLQCLVDSNMRPKLLDYGEGCSLKQKTENFAILHKYVLKDDSVVLSQPLPISKVVVNFRYRANAFAKYEIMIGYMDTISE